jgi:hypothetical protein
MTSEYVAVYFLTGQVVVGEMLDNAANSFKLKNPRTLFVGESNGKEIQVQFADFNPYGKSDVIELEDTDILFKDKLIDELKDIYIENVSGIIQAKTPGIIT